MSLKINELIAVINNRSGQAGLNNTAFQDLVYELLGIKLLAASGIPITTTALGPGSIRPITVTFPANTFEAGDGLLIYVQNTTPNTAVVQNFVMNMNADIFGDISEIDMRNIESTSRFSYVGFDGINAQWFTPSNTFGVGVDAIPPGSIAVNLKEPIVIDFSHNYTVAGQKMTTSNYFFAAIKSNLSLVT